MDLRNWSEVASSPGSYSITFDEPDIVVLTLSGHQNGETIRAATAQMGSALEARRVRFAYFAVDDIESFHPNVASAGADLLALLKKHGIELSVATTKNGAVRMMGQTISFAAGFKLRFVATKAEAYARLADARLAR